MLQFSSDRNSKTITSTALQNWFYFERYVADISSINPFNVLYATHRILEWLQTTWVYWHLLSTTLGGSFYHFLPSGRANNNFSFNIHNSSAHPPINVIYHYRPFSKIKIFSFFLETSLSLYWLRNRKVLLLYWELSKNAQSILIWISLIEWAMYKTRTLRNHGTLKISKTDFLSLFCLQRWRLVISCF